jgi:hypothetical protein
MKKALDADKLIKSNPAAEKDEVAQALVLLAMAGKPRGKGYRLSIPYSKPITPSDLTGDKEPRRATLSTAR